MLLFDYMQKILNLQDAIITNVKHTEIKVEINTKMPIYFISLNYIFTL